MVSGLKLDIHKVKQMKKSMQAQTRLDQICYQRILSPDFAQKTTFIQRVVRLVSGGAA